MERRNKPQVKREASSKQEAFDIINNLIDWDYDYDSLRSQNAGYAIYSSTRDGHNAWISDLGTRLEVNEGANTFNVWIVEQEVAHHFEVNLGAGRHNFTFGCSTAHEAFDAIEDAVATFGIEVDMDRIMEELVMLKKGKGRYFDEANIRVNYKEGEI